MIWNRLVLSLVFSSSHTLNNQQLNCFSRVLKADLSPLNEESILQYLQRPLRNVSWSLFSQLRYNSWEFSIKWTKFFVTDVTHSYLSCLGQVNVLSKVLILKKNLSVSTKKMFSFILANLSHLSYFYLFVGVRKFKTENLTNLLLGRFILRDDLLAKLWMYLINILSQTIK